MQNLFIQPGDYDIKIDANFSMADLKQIRNLLADEIEREENAGYQVLDRVQLLEKLEKIVQ